MIETNVLPPSHVAMKRLFRSRWSFRNISYQMLDHSPKDIPRKTFELAPAVFSTGQTFFPI